MVAAPRQRCNVCVPLPSESARAAFRSIMTVAGLGSRGDAVTLFAEARLRAEVIRMRT